MQKVIEAFLITLNALKGYKLRSFLTMLGVTIGIFAITLVFTLVNTMKFSVSKNLSSLGNAVLFVHNWPWKDNSEDWFKYFNRPKVSYQDYERLANNLRQVAGVCFEARVMGATVKAAKQSVEGITVLGVTYDYFTVSDLSVQDGRFFTPMETESGRDFCIIGSNLSKNLFGTEQATGQILTLRNRKLKIIGVLAKQGIGLFGQSKDDMLLIPYKLMANQYNLNRRTIDKMITVKAANYDAVDAVEGEITGLLRLERGLKPTQEDNFSINKQEWLMEQLNSIFYALNVGGGFISIFALLVGGFGISNIMFVSVKERTKEIGIQKALGATQGFILMQFLIESILLCLIGGVMGILGVIITSYGADLLFSVMGLGIAVIIAVEDVILALLLSALIGLMSGAIPAWRAARLDPVEAMRHK